MVRKVTDVGPLRLPPCKFHPRRKAVVWAKFGDKRGVDLCDECFISMDIQYRVARNGIDLRVYQQTGEGGSTYEPRI